jgi:Acetyltransferase (GNAT) domain
MITASCDERIDYEEIARVATEAFNSPDLRFSPDRIQWLYERCFSLGTTIVALRDGNRRIGHVAMVRQLIIMNGVLEHAVQIVDLCIIEEYRSKNSLRHLYDEVERQCMARNIRFALGMPNAKALSVNAYFFKMRPFLRLPIRVGLAVPFRSATLIASGQFELMTKSEIISLFAHYRTSEDNNGLQWDEDKLHERLCGPRSVYGVHATQDLLLISSARSIRGVKVEPGNVSALVRAACHLWRRPLFVYVGFNSALPINLGFPLPKWLRPSRMLLQLRDFYPNTSQPRFERYQLIDFDLA